MSNNEHTFILDNEYYTRTPQLMVTLINARDNQTMGVAMLGNQFDIPPSKISKKQHQGFGDRGIEPLVNPETGKMKPWDVWLVARQQQSLSAAQNMLKGQRE